MSALNETSEDGGTAGERIAKVIARSGLCSRRDAEVLIGEKRVSVNGKIIESAALDVLPSDKVLVDGKPLALREPPRLWRYHKPKGRVTTHKDPEGRPTVFEALPEGLPRLISIGRLDFNTEGLLLLTNDGDLARHLELPSTGWARRYRVRAYGQIEQSKLDELAAGLRTGGVNYGPIEASLEREQGDNVWITLSIREGKNREVRRIMEHLGLSVNRLIRVSYGPFMLGDLEPGQVEEVKTSVLKDQLGPRLSRQLGVKREPLREERRLAPQRPKPTYLRRKKEAEEPVRLREERPMVRRRILEEGSEEPKVEFVPEKRRRPQEGGERRPFRKRGDLPDREGRERRPRSDDAPSARKEGRFERDRGRDAQARFDGGVQRTSRPRRIDESRAEGDGPKPFKRRFERAEGDTAPGGEKRFSRPRRTEENRAEGGGAKPFKRRFERADGDTAPSGEKRFSRPRRTDENRTEGSGPKPFKRRFERADGDTAPSGEKRFSRHRRTDENRADGGGPKPFKRRFERAEGDTAPGGEKRFSRPRRTEENRAEGGGAKPFKRRFERAEGDTSQGSEKRFSRPRRTDENRSEGGDAKPFKRRFERADGDTAPGGEKRFSRPRRTEDRAEGGGPKPFKKRFEEGRSRPQRASGAATGGDSAKPDYFKKRDGSASGRDAPHRPKGAKPSGRRDGFARKTSSHGPRKPRPKPGGETS